MSKSLPETAPATAPTINRILDTAAALFWEKGYAATTTREIASAVGIQQASLYHHLARKEEILYQICVTSLREFLTGVESAVGHVDGPLQKVETLLRSHLIALLQHQKRNATMLTELRSLTRPHRSKVLALREDYSRFLQSTIETAQREGSLRKDVPAKYLGLAWLNILNWAALWFRADQVLSASRLADLFARICLEGAAPLSARTPEFESRRASSLPRIRKGVTGNPTLERLLDAAMVLFSRKGYAATSTREVAKLFGIQKASLYYHIESKEDLLYLICRASLEQIRTDVERAIEGAECPLHRVRLLIAAHIESVLRDAPKHSTTLAEMNSLTAERLEEVRLLRHSYEDLVRSVLAEAQKSGALRSDIEAKYLTLALLGLMNRVVVWYRRGGSLTPAQLGQLFGTIFLTGARSVV